MKAIELIESLEEQLRKKKYDVNKARDEIHTLNEDLRIFKLNHWTKVNYDGTWDTDENADEYLDGCNKCANMMDIYLDESNSAVEFAERVEWLKEIYFKQI